MFIPTELAHPLLFNTIVLILSLYILFKSADLIVYAISRYAKKLGLSEAIIGLVVVAIVTVIVASVFAVKIWKAKIEDVIIAWLILSVTMLGIYVIWPTTMTVDGTVRYTTGGPVVNEKVVLVDVYGVSRETRTNEAGYYRFNKVPVGSYTVMSGANAGGGGGAGGILVRTVHTDLFIYPPTSAPSPAPIAISTSTPSMPVSGLENNCINSDVWKSFKGGTVENECWQLQEVGMSAQEDGLLIFIDKNKGINWYGIYTEIPKNADIRFIVIINKLHTPSNDAARIAFGIIDPDDLMKGRFLYYRETSTQSLMKIDFGESIDNAMTVGDYSPYGSTQEVKISIRDITVQVFIDDTPIADPVSISFSKHGFGIYYRPVIDSSVSSTISELVIERK